MALIHQATIRPTKLELLDVWGPDQPWFEGEPGAGLTLVASFRLDDPAGEVGIETLLVRAGDGPVQQVPLTYRGAPLDGGDSWLITTMEHSVLGRRWVYNAIGDPVYRAVLAATVLTGGREADQYVESDGAPVLRAPTATVVGSGSDAGELASGTDGALIELMRTPAAGPPTAPVADHPRTEVLTGTWTEPGQQPTSLVLARVHL